ncbi:unnamed protein product, partial [Rotaria magnacalcarata]
QRTPTNTTEAAPASGNSTGKKRGRPRLSKPSVITNGDVEKTESNADTTPIPTKLTTAKPSITKPQAFRNTVKQN